MGDPNSQFGHNGQLAGCTQALKFDIGTQNGFIREPNDSPQAATPAGRDRTGAVHVKTERGRSPAVGRHGVNWRSHLTPHRRPILHAE